MSISIEVVGRTIREGKHIPSSGVFECTSGELTRLATEWGNYMLTSEWESYEYRPTLIWAPFYICLPGGPELVYGDSLQIHTTLRRFNGLYQDIYTGVSGAVPRARIPVPIYQLDVPDDVWRVVEGQFLDLTVKPSNYEKLRLLGNWLDFLYPVEERLRNVRA